MIGKLTVLMVTIAAVAAVNKVPVTIYYESLCSDSKAFYTKQFKPTWDDLKNYMNVELVPWGKSTSTDPNHTQNQPASTNFTCHHGPNECVGNKYHACILNPADGYNPEDQIKLIDCLMNRPGVATPPYVENIDACKDSRGNIEIDNLKRCVGNAANSNQLLLHQQDKTHKFQNPLTSVPTVAFNNQVDTEAVKNFRAALCKRITDTPKPKECEKSGAPATIVSLITLFAAGLVIRML